MSITLEIQGFEEVIELLANVDVLGQLEEITGTTVDAGARFAAAMTPVDTAAMQRAWMAEAKGLEGRMFIDPSAINPRSGAPVTSYAPAVDERVGIVDKTFIYMVRTGAALLEGVTWTPR